tara:strand:+ start:4571 stop:4882 length:312 start_codon:yes stop_codon:yes gene_type:complete
MLLSKNNLIIKSSCIYCINRQRKYIDFMKKFNKKYKKKSTDKLLKLIKSKKYNLLYIDYLLCYKKYYPKYYKKYFNYIKKILKKLDKSNELFKFYSNIIKNIN